MTEPTLEERPLEPSTEATETDATPTLENELLETLVDEVRTLRAENERLAARVETLEAETNALERSVETLDSDTVALEHSVDDLETQTETLESRTEALETEHTHLRDRLADDERALEQVEALTEATRNRTGANKARLAELQARELEKGAHLRESNVDAHEVNVPDGTLERFTKTDGRAYYRLPDRADPLDRERDIALAHGDLLPIQQLARMDEDMRRSTANSLPTRLAAKLWRARTDSTVGDDPWKTGCRDIRKYLEASDLKHWIRRQEQGISETYAKKLVSRTIDAILECSKHRLAVRKRTQRKNGLEYTERRLVLPADAEIPGETTATTETTGETDATAAANATDATDTNSTNDTTDADRQAPETADVLG